MFTALRRQVVDGEHRNAGGLQRRELGLDRGVAQDADHRVDLARQQDVVVVGMDLIVAPAIDADHGAAQRLDLLGGTIEGLAVPEMLGADHGDADRLAGEAEIRRGGGEAGERRQGACCNNVAQHMG